MRVPSWNPPCLLIFYCIHLYWSQPFVEEVCIRDAWKIAHFIYELVFRCYVFLGLFCCVYVPAETFVLQGFLENIDRNIDLFTDYPKRFIGVFVEVFLPVSQGLIPPLYYFRVLLYIVSPGCPLIITRSYINIVSNNVSRTTMQEY